MGFAIVKYKWTIWVYFYGSNSDFLGNDAIVAFSRRYEVVVVIHQLNEALWKIGEDDEKPETKKKCNR